jgi:hypothetical protein
MIFSLIDVNESLNEAEFAAFFPFFDADADDVDVGEEVDVSVMFMACSWLARAPVKSAARSFIAGKGEAQRDVNATQSVSDKSQLPVLTQFHATLPT